MSPAPATDTLVLGLGNLVHSDDGVGVHLIELLSREPQVPPGVELLDGGTHGLNLLSRISGLRRLLVVDAVDVGEPPGTIVRFEGAALSGLPGKPSVHQLGFADLMTALQLIGGAPEEIVVLGVQPLSTEWSLDLTPPVRSALEPLAAAVLGQIQLWALQCV
jgi:hydrogenase maturation protease